MDESQCSDASDTLDELPRARVYRELLYAIYDMANPDKRAEVPRLLQKYEDFDLYVKVCYKYGIHRMQYEEIDYIIYEAEDRGAALQEAIDAMRADTALCGDG